jgi:predicted amidophosphoribosyltransferase
MNRQCPQCHFQYPSDQILCTQCEAELIDNGYLLDSLAFWNTETPSKFRIRIIPLSLVVLSGVISFLLHTNLFLFVGIIAALLYNYRQAKKE